MNTYSKNMLAAICMTSIPAQLRAGDLDKLADASVKNQVMQEATPQDIQYRISAGTVYRKFGGIDFRTGGVSERSPFFKTTPESSFTKVGDSGTTGNREYDDGYVKKDAGTDLSDGLTRYWGYSNASQVQNGNLSYHSNLGFDSTSGNTEWSSSDESWAPYLSFEMLFPVKPGLKFGPYASISYSEISSQKNGLQTLSSSRQTLRDTYFLDGVIPPDAPYSGTFTGPGPLINNIPTTRQIESSGDIAYNEIAEFLDLNLTTVTLGFSLDYSLAKLHLFGSIGATINYTELEAGHDEKLFSVVGGSTDVVSTYRARNNDADFLFGLMGQFGTSYEIVEQWSIGVFGRYDWVEDLKGEAGPSSYAVDLSGWSLGTILSYSY